jgi:hypothetical protein
MPGSACFPGQMIYFGEVGKFFELNPQRLGIVIWAAVCIIWMKSGNYDGLFIPGL